MRKKILLAPFLIFLNCTVIKQINNEKIITNTNYTPININSKNLLIDIEVDQSPTKFILDTGSGLTVLTDSTIIPDFINKNFSYFGSSKGADRKKTKNRFLTLNIKSGLFESQNKVIAYIKMNNQTCLKSHNLYSGIIGNDFFFGNNTSMHLDFSKNKIGNINADQIQTLLINEGYKIIKSECNNSQIFVYLKVEGKEIKFKLDTGYSGSIIIPYSNKNIFLNQNKTEFIGSVFQTINGQTAGKEIYYEKMPITFGDENLESKTVVSNSIKAQNIGMEFIKGFDWIIDYNNNKVYIKRNKINIENILSKKQAYYSKIDNQKKLVVIVKELSQTKFNIGDQIISVNNELITEDNICEMMNLLNKTPDWNTLKIEIKK